MFTAILIYNHNQLPMSEDVFASTKNWSPATEEVYLVKQIDGEWLTIFRNQHSVMLAELKQNWLGLWEVRDELGNESTLTSTYYPHRTEDDMTWSAGGVGQKEVSYYFGQVISPEVQKVFIETEENEHEEVSLIEASGNRFFFKKINGELFLPVNIKGYSESGELMYSTINEGKLD